MVQRSSEGTNTGKTSNKDFQTRRSKGFLTCHDQFFSVVFFERDSEPVWLWNSAKPERGAAAGSAQGKLSADCSVHILAEAHIGST